MSDLYRKFLIYRSCVVFYYFAALCKSALADVSLCVQYPNDAVSQEQSCYYSRNQLMMSHTLHKNKTVPYYMHFCYQIDFWLVIALQRDHNEIA